MKHSLNENLENGDLSRLISREVQVDEYKSKMGNDKDICVVSFTVINKEPATDLMAFIEKGYDWVLDADVSSGEKSSGEYLVFVELDRTPDLPEHIDTIVNDITNLIDFDREEWIVKYHKSQRGFPLNVDTLAALIPLTPDAYASRFNKDMNEMRAIAGIKITSTAPVNAYTDSLRIAAGLK